jgi:hypothetical protein
VLGRPVGGSWAALFASAALLAGMALAGCQAVPGRSSGTSSAPVVQELECRAKAYPCSLEEVPEEILRRSEELSLQADAMIGRGEPINDVAAFLQAQDGVVELTSDAFAVRFRLDGGRPFWVMHPDALGPVNVESGAAAAQAPWFEPPARPPAAPRPETDEASADPRHVAGGNDKPKRALVLSPWLWEFGATDDGAAVRQTLDQTRDYEGNVTYVANGTKTAFNVNVESFKGWKDYDVVHVVAHGYRVCDDAGCRALIGVHELPGGLLSYFTPDRGFALELKPVAKAFGTEVLSGNGRSLLFLNADFFVNEYPGGLADTLVFFNACKTAGTQATDLSDAIRGTSSVFVGWNESVSWEHAHAVGVDLFSTLTGGWTVDHAYEDLGPLQQDGSVDPAAHLIVDGRADGGDLRIREIVWLLDPALEGPLFDGALVGIDGTMNDGGPDSVPYEVQIDGFAESEVGGLQLHVAVDDQEVQRPLADATFLGEGKWQIEGLIPLGEDLAEERPATMKAWLDLPDGGQSRDHFNVRLVGPGCLTGTWVIDKALYHQDLDNLLASIPGADALPLTGDIVLEFAPATGSQEGDPVTVRFQGDPTLSGPAATKFVSGITLTTTSADGDVLAINLYVDFSGFATGLYTTPEANVLLIHPDPDLPVGDDWLLTDVRATVNGQSIPDSPLPASLTQLLAGGPLPVGAKAVYTCTDANTLEISPENSMRVITYRRAGS